MKTAALRALAIPEILSHVLVHAGDECACSYSSFQLVSRAWRDAARPIALRFAMLLLQPSNYWMSCKIDDYWTSSDHKEHSRSISLTDLPTIHRDVGAVYLGLLYLPPHVNRRRFLQDAWDTIALCSRVHKVELDLTRKGDLRKHNVRLAETLREAYVQIVPSRFSSHKRLSASPTQSSGYALCGSLLQPVGRPSARKESPTWFPSFKAQLQIYTSSRSSATPATTKKWWPL